MPSFLFSLTVLRFVIVVCAETLLAVGGRSDDLALGPSGEQSLKARQKEGVVVGQDNPITSVCVHPNVLRLRLCGPTCLCRVRSLSLPCL